MSYTVGIDLGGTNIVAGIVDRRGKLLATAKEKTHLPSTAERIVDVMVRTARQAVENAGISWETVAYVGAGVPGSVNFQTGLVEYANNLEFYDVPLRSMLERGFDRPVFIANDADAAAYGEYMAGAGKNCESLVAITLGTGVGSGIILDGKLLTGCNYNAGELGHMPICYGGIPCNCGLSGCFEAYASASALVRQTREAMLKNASSVLWQMCDGDINRVDGKTAFDCMRAGDETAKRVIDQYLTYLGVGITGMINIFQPETLCIGGGLSREGETLLAPLRRFVAGHVYSRTSQKQTQIMAAMLGNEAGVIGAAMLGGLGKNQSG